MTIKTGAAVRQIQPAPLQGAVVERRFNESEEQMEYHVTSADGAVDRWFLESQIEDVTPATPGA